MNCASVSLCTTMLAMNNEMMQKPPKKHFKLHPQYKYRGQKRSKNVNSFQNFKSLFHVGILQLGIGPSFRFWQGALLQMTTPISPWIIYTNTSGTFRRLSENQSAIHRLTNRISKRGCHALDTHAPVLPKSSGSSERTIDCECGFS